MSAYGISVSEENYQKIERIRRNLEANGLGSRRLRGKNFAPRSQVIDLACADILGAEDAR